MDELENGKTDLDLEALTALRRGISKDDATLIKFWLERRCAAFTPAPDRPISMSVSVSVTMEDILKEIDGQTTGLLDVTKKPLVIDHD